MRFSAIFFTAQTGAWLLAGCATKSPPTRAEIHEQSGSLTNLVLTNGWKAGALTGAISDTWLGTFTDTKLNALVAEPMTTNPNLRASAPGVDQAPQNAGPAKAALGPAVTLFGTGGLNMGAVTLARRCKVFRLGHPGNPT